MRSRTTLNIPDVDWERYKQITELQEQRLYEELTKPHNSWLALILNLSHKRMQVLKASRRFFRRCRFDFQKTNEP